ncbi:MAG: EAL domain-containing protein, partial [Selenomonadaceae bacterium]|nr:EAL domain-containing protein [Selenomonadaceae bacterium]
RGYGYEYMEFLSRYGDWKFEYVPSTTWNECNDKLQAGLIDLLPAMPGDYRSIQNVVRTDHVIGRYPMALITKDGSIKPQMRLGTIPVNAPLPSLPKVAASEGFTYELVTFPKFYDMEEAFKRNEIDGYISPMLEPNKEKNVASIFDRQSYRLLVRPDRKDLLAAMNIAMDEMLMDQPNIRNRLNDKYLRTGGSPLILNHQEKEYLIQKQKLKTAILIKEKPYAYEDADGNIHGVIQRLIQQISEDLNIEIEIVDTETAAEAANLIKTGQIDFIADCICDFSWAATMNMAPTQAYLQLEYVPVSRRGSNIDNLKKVACATDLLYTKNFVFSRYTEDNRVYADSLEECFKIVSEGRADILFAPRSEVPYLIEETGSYNLEVALESDFADELSLGVYTGEDRRLWRILNKEVNHLDISKIRNSVNEDISTTSHRFSPQWLIYHYPLRAMAIMALIVALIAAAVWYRFYIRRKHTQVIHHMAYTDSRYNLPNIMWLIREAPKTYNNLDEDDKCYIVNFELDKVKDNDFIYERDLLDKQLKNMAEQLDQMDWVLLTSTSNEVGGLVCLCKAQNNMEITRLAKESIRKFGYLQTKDSKIWINLKSGISEVDTNDLQQSIQKAQAACSESQNDVRFFDSELQKELEFVQKVESHMEAALNNNEFQVWYQTEYDIKTRKPIGAEAFVRWQSSELGFLRPDKFLRVFERNGFMIVLDYFVLDEVCKLQRLRLDNNKEVVPIAVNQSRLHINEENYLNKVKSIIKKYKLPKHLIKLEFSEAAFESLNQPEQQERVKSIIRNLQNMGVYISVDNFGSGYSSYKLLDSLSIDEMKIDRSILNSNNVTKRKRDILDNIIKLGKFLNMNVICEGIETEEQEQLLLELGCRYGQGFLMSNVELEMDTNNA